MERARTTKDKIEDLLEPFGFRHNPGNRTGFLGNLGRTSYGRGGRPYSFLDRNLRRLGTVVSAGVLAVALTRGGYDTGAVRDGFTDSMEQIDDAVNKAEDAGKCPIYKLGADRRGSDVGVVLQGDKSLRVRYNTTGEVVSAIVFDGHDGSDGRIMFDEGRNSGYVSLNGYGLHGLDGRRPGTQADQVQSLLGDTTESILDDLAPCEA